MPYYQHKKRTTQRPYRFRLNRNHHFYDGLLLAGLGSNHGSDSYLDSGPQSFHGSLEGYVQSDVWSYHLGRVALPFDGDDDAVRFGSIALGDPLTLAGSDLTITAWMWQQTGGDSYQRLVDKSDGGNGANGYSFITQYANASAKNLQFIAAGSTTETVSEVYQLEQWHHVGVRLISGGIPEILVDGTLQAVTGVATTVPDATADLSLGTWNHNVNREFGGLLADVCIWQRWLTDDEFLILANPNDSMLSGFIMPVPTITYFIPTPAAEEPITSIFESSIIGV